MDTEKKDRIRLELTPEQRKQIRETLGEDVSTLEFTAKELEQRITPYYMKF